MTLNGQVAQTCRGKCRAAAVPGPKPNERNYYGRDGGRVYCKQCRVYFKRRPECPCDPHHQLKGQRRAADARRKAQTWQKWADLRRAQRT